VSALASALPATSAAAGAERWIAAGAVLLAVLASAALVFAWNTQQRVKVLEVELVKRQQESGSQATEARTLARQAEGVVREVAGRVALLDERLAETSLQRTQFEDLVQSLARSRDENVLADIDTALRVALQQTAITGSVDPLVVTLRQADERLGRHNQPRLEGVRRAVAQDLDRVRAAGHSDIGVLAARLQPGRFEVGLVAAVLADGDAGRPGVVKAPAALGHGVLQPCAAPVHAGVALQQITSQPRRRQQRAGVGLAEGARQRDAPARLVGRGAGHVAVRAGLAREQQPQRGSGQRRAAPSRGGRLKLRRKLRLKLRLKERLKERLTIRFKAFFTVRWRRQ